MADTDAVEAYDPAFSRPLRLVRAYEANPPPPPAPGETAGGWAVGRLHGRPVLLENGHPAPAMCMLPGIRADDEGFYRATRDFAAAGVDVTGDTLWPFLDMGSACCRFWRGPGDYDFDRIDRRFRQALRGNPRAKLLVRIKLNVPAWWLETYPDECSRLRPADDEIARKAAEIYRANYGRVPDSVSMQPSFASRRWREDAGRMLADLVRHFEESPDFGDRVMGYLPAGGESSEWFWWGYYNGLVDYSENGIRAFSTWLRAAYANDVSALRDAWRDPDAAFDAARPPAPEARLAGEDGYFRDPLRARPVADYRRFLTDATVDALLDMARIARQHTTRPRLIGAFYGYSAMLDGGVAQRMDNLGFLGLKRVLASPDVDFICSPISYFHRRGGDAGLPVCAYNGSLRLHGKLFYQEADMRTHLFPGDAPYKTTTREETRNVHWRCFGNALADGHLLWWFLLADNASFHADSLMEDIARMAAFERRFLTLPFAPAADVAVFVDEESMLHVNSGFEQTLRTPEELDVCRSSDDPYAFDRLASPFTAELLHELPRLGMAYAVYLLDDIDHPDRPPAKFCLFLNAFHLTAAKRERIHARLRRDGATACWLYAPGYLDDGGASIEGLTRATGMRFARHDGPECPRDTHLFGEATVGRPYRMAPWFSVADPTAETLGRAGGKVTLARKTTDGVTHVYSSLPPTVATLRRLAEDAGAHGYIRSGDVFQANRDFILLHASSDGNKRVTLPGAECVTELITGRDLGEVAEFGWPLKNGETAIFRRRRDEAHA